MNRRRRAYSRPASGSGLELQALPVGGGVAIYQALSRLDASQSVDTMLLHMKNTHGGKKLLDAVIGRLHHWELSKSQKQAMAGACIEVFRDAKSTDNDLANRCTRFIGRAGIKGRKIQGHLLRRFGTGAGRDAAALALGVVGDQKARGELKAAMKRLESPRDVGPSPSAMAMYLALSASGERHSTAQIKKALRLDRKKLPRFGNAFDHLMTNSLVAPDALVQPFIPALRRGFRGFRKAALRDSAQFDRLAKAAAILARFGDKQAAKELIAGVASSNAQLREAVLVTMGGADPWGETVLRVRGGGLSKSHAVELVQQIATQMEFVARGIERRLLFLVLVELQAQVHVKVDV